MRAKVVLFHGISVHLQHYLIYKRREDEMLESSVTDHTIIPRTVWCRAGDMILIVVALYAVVFPADAFAAGQTEPTGTGTAAEHLRLLNLYYLHGRHRILLFHCVVLHLLDYYFLTIHNIHTLCGRPAVELVTIERVPPSSGSKFFTLHS